MLSLSSDLQIEKTFGKAKKRLINLRCHTQPRSLTIWDTKYQLAVMRPPCLNVLSIRNITRTLKNSV